MSTFIQYLHSGREYKPSRSEIQNGLMEWHYQDIHRRKFLKSSGRYWTRGVEIADDLLFWGEWEPESHLTKIGTNWIHTPVLAKDGTGQLVAPPLQANIGGIQQCRQFTDPYVFGDDGFLLSVCGQTANWQTISMSHLERGDIIVFGSCLNKHFVVDTVFVIGDYVDYNTSQMIRDLSGFVPNVQEYVDLMIYGLSHKLNNRTAALRCYKGATPSNPINGMFSFVPCKLRKGTYHHFNRPALVNSDFVIRSIPFQKQNLISHTLLSGYNITNHLDQCEMKQIWQRLYDVLIFSTGLCAGTHFSPVI